MRTLARLFLWLLLSLSPLVSFSAQRLALVVGNAAYTQASPLRNPVNDARAVAERLRALGFEVMLRTDLRRNQVGATLKELRDRVRPGDDVVFFYAGHGVQVGGVNYLLAVDADISSELDVPLNAINVGTVLGVLEESRAAVKLVILDACRNNPYSTGFRSADRGLSRVSSAPSGTLISFATRPGAVAADGDGANGVFTTALLRHIGTPGLPLEQTLKRVATDVETATQGRQDPWIEGNIRGEFYFAKAEASAPSSPPIPVPAPVRPAPVAPAAPEVPGFPSRPITIVVPFVAGGPTDAFARILAAEMSKAMSGAAVIVEARPGAGGTTGAQGVARSTPDGHTLLFHHFGMSTAPALYRSLAFDPLKDFEYVGLVNETPLLLVARAGFPARSLGELVAQLRSNPRITMATGGVGTASHLCAFLLGSAAGADPVTVPYRGTAPALTDLLAGQTELMCEQTSSLMPHVQAGKVRAIAITSGNRFEPLGSVPTAAEAGLPGLAMSVWHGLYAPKGTPAPVVAKLVDALQAALRTPDALRRYRELGAEPVAAARQTPEGLQALLDSEIRRWRPVIARAGIYAD